MKSQYKAYYDRLISRQEDVVCLVMRDNGKQYSAKVTWEEFQPGMAVSAPTFSAVLGETDVEDILRAFGELAVEKGLIKQEDKESQVAAISEHKDELSKITDRLLKKVLNERG